MENLLDTIINDFHPEKFITFFREKNCKFKPLKETTTYLDDENFFNSIKLGEIPFDEVTKLVVYAFQVKNPLSERSGKKAQYEKGKKILKDDQADAGIFIFYDGNGNFRFSLIHTEYYGTKRSWNNFKRFTYFVSKDQTNKTFKKQVGEGDFSSLENIKTAFSVEKVTKEFYQEIANWYFWAMDKIWFPEDYKYNENPEKDKEIRIATNLIRLITRIIFIWFIKQKGLVPDKLFDKDFLKEIVKDFGKSTNYYNAILQNLFFGTLNQRKEQRGFANDGDFLENRTHFGIKTLYRYKDLFNIPEEEVLKLFEDVPFLNGGLFDCLDKDNIYIDGFSRNPKKRAKISDDLFFQEDITNVDLSKYEMGKNKPVRGLIEILKSYNFTIDESTPVDQEVALDPELLGKIFENLLASYNPETSTTARKATGSYYTPREIVDYMVDESLKAYLKVTEASRFAKVIEASCFANKVTEASRFAYPFLNPNQDLKVHYGKKGTLPHWQQGDVWYFVTFRLADSLPAEKIEELKTKREDWLKHHGGNLENLNENEREEYYKLFSEKIEEWLNAGYGSCILKDYEIAKIVKDTLCFFNGKRYILDEWVIMPNHVHVLVKPIDNNSISDILHSWKSYSAKQILKVIEASRFANKVTEVSSLHDNKVTEASCFAKVTKTSPLCSSHQVWLHESYDHIVRNENAFNAIRKYIRENPAKANITILDICCSWRVNDELTNQDGSITLTNRDGSVTMTNRDGSDTLRSEDASITMLLSYSDDVPEITEEEKIAIVKAISDIKILDPACGSGAFPMGILHKLLLILQKVDPENTLWYKLQREKVLKEIDDVLNTEDSKEREELLMEINDAFDTKINHPDYARKLFLIENCIYGVDIQPIAIQISKLRFFISLIIDQNVDKTKDNFGITPLPNLETKFVCANTLIGLDKPNGVLVSPQVTQLEEKIKTLRHRYFQAKTRTQKLSLQKKDKELRDKLAEELAKNGFSTTASRKIADFDPYDQNSSADWFDPEWMFGVTDGFDIVIGNPPYIQLQKNSGVLANLYKDKGFETFERTGDIYTLFYEKGINLLKPKGHLCLITSNKWMRAGYGESLRKYFTKHNPKILVDLGPGIFESATVDTNILLIQRAENQNNLKAVTLRKEAQINIENQLKEQGVILNKLTQAPWFIGSSAEQRLKEKIERLGKPLKDWDVNIYRGVLTGLNEAFIITTEKREEILSNCRVDSASRFAGMTERERTSAIIKPILRGRDIKRYYYEWAGLWVIVIPAGWTNENRGKKEPEIFINESFPSLMRHLKQFESKAKKRDDQGDYWWELRHCAYYPEFEKEKVVWQRITHEPTFCLVEPNVLILDSMAFFTGNNLKFIMALLNSKLIFKYVEMIVHQYGFTGFRLSNQYVEMMPLPPITTENQPIVNQIEALVDKIITVKKQNPQSDTTNLEREIDNLVYKLYDLTEEEIKIIENNKN